MGSKKAKKTVVIVISIFLLLFAALEIGFLFMIPKEPGPTYLEIDDDTELANYCQIGNGTEEFPYVIENLEITDGYRGIEIRDTEAYLTIQNNTIRNQEAMGIELTRCSNVKIINNSIFECGWGIHLSKSNNCQMSNNLLFKTGRGINIVQSIHINIVNNNCINVSFGIEHIGSTYSSILNNTCFTRSIGITEGYDSMYNLFYGNNCTSFGDGWPTGILIHGKHSTVSNNYCSSSDKGIYISTYSDNSSVKMNYITQNDVGISISSESDVNTIWNNLFINNTGSHTSGASNIKKWDNGTIGNYWDDYTIRYPNATINPDGVTWDTPYLISNSMGDTYDNYPLVYPIIYPE